MKRRPRIKVIGTGGSISSPGSGPLNLFDYAEHGGGPVEVDELLAMFAPFLPVGTGPATRPRRCA